jgi:hypothetical protein
MTTWRDEPIPEDEDGSPMFAGLRTLLNDKGERIGPISTLDGAMARIDRILIGADPHPGETAAYARGASR